MLAQGVVFLAAVVVAVPLFGRLGLGSVLGYLAAGVSIGPQAVGPIGEVEAVLHFAEPGVVLLVFVIGLQLTRQVLLELGLGAAEAARAITTFRDHGEQRLRRDFRQHDDEERMRYLARQSSRELEEMCAADLVEETAGPKSR